MRLEIHVTVWRGPVAEARHRLQAVACDAAGVARAASAEAGRPTGFRSAAKPFQALAAVERGHAGRFGFGDEAIALMCASHAGGAVHVRVVRDMLARIGLEPRHLACGIHPPEDPDALAEVSADPARRSPLHNNCSGKHAGMLAVCVAEGWPVEGYHLPAHPLQRLLRDTVAEVAGLPAQAIEGGVDGCSVPAFALPLDAMARAYARLATARGDGDARERALARIRVAMQAHPVLTGGRGRFGVALMEALGDRAVSKVGAEGLECVGLPRDGLGLAVKCEDGAARAVGPAVVALLDALGVTGPADAVALDALRRPPVVNHAGLVTGRIEAEVRVLRGAPA